MGFSQLVPTKLGFGTSSCSSSQLSVSSSRNLESGRYFASSISFSRNSASKLGFSSSISSSRNLESGRYSASSISSRNSESKFGFTSSISSSSSNPASRNSPISSSSSNPSKLGFSLSSSSLQSRSSSSSPGVSVFEGSEFPKVVEVDDIVSELFLTPWSRPIRALTGSTPVFGELFRNTKYAFPGMILTLPCYWIPPRVTKRNRKYIIKHWPSKKGWHRLVSDASLVKKKTAGSTPRAGCGFMVRNSSMQPVCTGEWMVTNNPQEEIEFYEMLSLTQALGAIGSSWFPLEISTDNIFVMKILNDDRLEPHINDMQGLIDTDLYEEKYLVLYQKIMQLIQAQIIVSGGQWGWTDREFKPLPREANHTSDFLATTVEIPGLCIITLPGQNCQTLDTEFLHPLLNYIRDREISFGFIKLHHAALLQRALFAKKLKLGLLKYHEVPPDYD